MTDSAAVRTLGSFAILGHINATAIRRRNSSKKAKKISVARNTSYNLIGSILSILTMIATVPLFLSFVGIERYGIYSVAIAFLGYFGLFDLGVSRATARKVADLRRTDQRAVATVVWTALVVSISFSILGAVLIAIGADLFFERGMLLSADLEAEAAQIGPLLGALLLLTLLTGLIAGVLQGFERFLRLNLVNVVGSVITQIFPLVAAALVEPTLKWLLIGLCVARIITLAGLVVALVTARTGCPLWARPQKALALDILSFGGWVSVSAVIGPILSTTDRMVIGALLGPRAVAIFTIPFGLVRRVELLPMALAAAIFPRLVAEKDATSRAKIAAKGVALLSVAVTPMIVCGGLLLEPFLILWIDAAFAREAAPVGAFLLIAFWAKSQTIIPYELLTAQGRPDLVAKLHLVEVAPYLVVLGVGVHLFGIEGAAGAWALRAMADSALLHHLAIKHAGLSSRPHIVAPMLLIASTVVVSTVFPIDSALRLIAGAILAAISILWAWRVSPEDLKRRLAIL